MNLTIAQLWQLLQSLPTIVVMSREYTKGDQHLVSMQTWILAAQILNLCLLDGLDEALRDEFDLVIDACQIFGGIE